MRTGQTPAPFHRHPGLACLDVRQGRRMFGDMVNGSYHRLGQVDLAQPVMAITDVETAINVGSA